MQLTINDRMYPFPAPGCCAQDGVPPSDLATVVIAHYPKILSRVLLAYGAGDEYIHWTLLLWQLVELKSHRPDLVLVLKVPMVSAPWFRLLSSLGISTEDEPEVGRPPALRLTLMESRVLLLLLAGSHVQDIAAQLQRDTRTISSHKQKAMSKVGLLNNGELYELGAQLYKTCKVRVAQVLAPAEQQMLACLFVNGSVTTTAKMLHKSVKTVSAQKRNIMRKLGVPHEVALYALRNVWRGVGWGGNKE
jgi:DNA-binding CsgD family transcriptional regulator